MEEIIMEVEKQELEKKEDIELIDDSVKEVLDFDNLKNKQIELQIILNNFVEVIKIINFYNILDR